MNKDLKQLISLDDSADLMPVLFIGHGSPMNAIEENIFVEEWRSLGRSLPTPKAILCISAHWETNGTQVTAMSNPSTIHDFGGFPPQLYQVRYPAPGDPVLANEISKSVKGTPVGLDGKWGLDHGAWSVIRNMYPDAGIPVIEMSLDYNKTALQHFELAAELSFLRRKGVLIIGSGNIVHNLRSLAWDHAGDQEYGYDWAIEANEKFKKLITGNNFGDLINYRNLGKEVQLSVPTPEHFLPMIYTLALKGEKESFSFFNDKAIMGSLTMTSFKID